MNDPMIINTSSNKGEKMGMNCNIGDDCCVLSATSWTTIPLLTLFACGDIIFVIVVLSITRQQREGKNDLVIARISWNSAIIIQLTHIQRLEKLHVDTTGSTIKKRFSNNYYDKFCWDALFHEVRTVYIICATPHATSKISVEAGMTVYTFFSLTT
jgi:hypothetical protein